MIDLERVTTILKECEVLVSELHGAELDERRAVQDQRKGQVRQERARRSQELNLLAARLDLAADLVRLEYWYARGEMDPLDPQRGTVDQDSHRGP